MRPFNRIGELIGWSIVGAFSVLVVVLDSALARAAFLAFPIVSVFVIWRFATWYSDRQWMRRREMRLSELRQATENGTLVAVKGEAAVGRNSG